MPAPNAPAWGEDDEPSAEQIAFWSGRQSLWLATVGRGNGRRLLDLGCGFGHFVSWAADAGWDVWGVEPDASARARSAAPDRVVADLDRAPGEFDQITLWDVLEHVEDPIALMRSVGARLNPGGHVLVSSPHFFAMRLRWWWLKRDANRFNAVIKPDEHVVQFSRRGVRLALERAGLVDIRFTYPPPSRVHGWWTKALTAPGIRPGLFALAAAPDGTPRRD